MAVFSRTTVIEAVSLLDDQPHSNIDRLIIRFGLEESISGSRQKYVKEKVNAVSSYLIEHQDLQGANNSDLTCEVIEFLVQDIPDPDEDDSFEASQDRYFKLRNSLARDGYRVKGGKLRTILPENIDLSKKESELELFLKSSDFKIARGHFEQAIDAHTRGAWAAANGQLRTFVESLFDEIAKRVVGVKLWCQILNCELHSSLFTIQDLTPIFWDDLPLSSRIIHMAQGGQNSVSTGGQFSVDITNSPSGCGQAHIA